MSASRASRKRARTADTAASTSSSQPTAAALRLTLSGGVPHHPSLAGLWRDERLTDFALCAEGVEFKAHRVALASSSKYFLNLFESGMRDAADATHALEGIRPKALEALLAYIYEGKCEIDEDQLTEVLEASARLVVDTLKECLIYIVGGSNGRGAGGRLSMVELYDPQNASWKQLAGMAGPRSAHTCVALEGKLYAVGGTVATAGLSLDTAEVYDPQTDGWQPLVKMGIARSGLGLAAVGGKIYAIGGWSGLLGLDSVEAYDPQLGAWAPVGSMSVKRSNHASVVLDSKIYTIGGENDVVTLYTVEVYDPQADSWQQVASLPQPLYAHAVAAMGGKIYVTGGNTQLTSGSIESSVYVYNSQANTWTQLASMGITRRGHASAAVGDKLYVFGGHGVGAARLSTAEVYDPASDSWAPVSSLTSARSHLVTVAL